MHYQFKQDLAMAYFPDNSKETASKRFAHEIHSNKILLAALQTTGYSRPNATIAFIRTMGIVRGSAHKSTGLVHIPQTTPNHLLLPR